MNARRSKLSVNDVARIRAAVAAGRTQTSVAAEYGITATAVSLIVREVIHATTSESNGFLLRKRERERRWRQAKRAALTPEERAARRREYDRAYRERHREERRKASLDRYHRLKKQQTPAA